jgi:RNA polymerase sigma-70 factor (ECF subfamily)
MLSRKPHPEMDDSELLEYYKKSSDVEAAGLLYNRYTALVYGVCLKYLKDREDAKDAVMQLFEKLVSILNQHEIVHFKSWLYVTPRNYCLMQLRAKKGLFKEELSPQIMETETDPHLENGDELEANLGKLERCIEELTNEQKECVKLFFLQQKCYKDVASRTGFDMNKVKSYIQNGKRNLKICMERNE